jgi:mono/diheme cytochrome c family protein
MANSWLRTCGRAVGAAAMLLLPPGAGRAVEPENLRHGLIAAFRDAGNPPAEVIRLEPSVALALKAGEAAHPALHPDGGLVVWRGYLNVIRSGPYRFLANLRGKFRLTLDGNEVLAGATAGDAPETKEGPEVRLDAGVHPLVAEFTRAPGAAKVEVLWKGPGFRTEPLPVDAVGFLPKEAPPQLAAQAKIDQGRYLAQEHACARCHQPAADDRMAKTLTARQAPDLSKVGARVHAGWIEKWLEAPEKLRPGAAMPALFADDDNGRVERYAVAHYLASLGGPVPTNPKPPSDTDAKVSAARGEKVFNTVGCIACHGEADKQDGKTKDDGGAAFITAAAAHFPLTGLASKTTPEKLAEYLQNPLAVDPSGRMPSLALQGQEAQDLARYLCQSEDQSLKTGLSDAPAADKLLAAWKRVETKADAVNAFEKLPPAAQADELGKRLVVAKGCANCHSIAPNGQQLAPAATFTALENLTKKPNAGCLADKPETRGDAPAFAMSAADRDALRAFLADGLMGAGAPAPVVAARETIRQMNCLACHSRDGEGGLTPGLVEQLRKFENAENAEAVAPPTLTGVGHKLRTPWMKQVLTGGARARPWMALRMPQFGDANVGRLPDQVDAAEGAEADDAVYKTPLTAAKIEAGRTLIGKSAFGCISCHDLAGIPNTGTRGPDLAGMNQRVRYEWYQRWLEQPQRIQPGTRMPQVFTDGKSLLPTVLNGDAAAQADALWGYLSLGPGLPMPDGIGPPKGMAITVKDKPYLLRTFMPDAGSRAVAVGFPSGVSAAFDAHTCRLAYAWTGQFLDASPVWDGRGGNPAHVLGPHIWNAPAGCPVAATPSNEPPDFAARAKDPDFGAPLPEGQLFKGVQLVHFDGYDLDKEGAPTFRYHLQAGTDDRLGVSERLEALRNGAAAGVARHFTLELPGKQTAWLLAGECGGEPKSLDAKGAAQLLDLKSGPADFPAAGKALLLPQDGDRVTVLTLPAAPDGTTWRVQKGGAGWQVLVRVPAAAADGKPRLDLNVWAPYRNEPDLLKELLSAR